MKARYKVMIGLGHGINDLMRRADLFGEGGGVGLEHEVAIEWKDGEEVTPIRARSAMLNAQEESRGTDQEILSWELLSIETYSK